MAGGRAILFARDCVSLVPVQVKFYQLHACFFLHGKDLFDFVPQTKQMTC